MGPRQKRFCILKLPSYGHLFKEKQSQEINSVVRPFGRSSRRFWRATSLLRPEGLKKSNGNPVIFLPKGLAHNLLLVRTTMKTGDSLKTTMLIRSQKTGVVLPRQGTFVRDIENLGRKLILVDFGSAGEEYLFPNEVLDEIRNG